MTALAANRTATVHSLPGYESYPIADNVHAYQGGIAVVSGGNVQPGTTATGLLCAGIFRSEYDNTIAGHAAGAKNLDVEEGKFWVANSGDIAASDVGSPCFIVDDQTVSKASSGKSPAGIIRKVDSALGVQVEMSLPLSDTLTKALAAEPAASIQSGTATLVAGTVTVSSVTITASSKIVVTRNTPGGTLGTDGYDVPAANRTVGAGTGSFVINAVNADKSTGTLDTSTIDWIVIG